MRESKWKTHREEECELPAKVRWQDFSAALQRDEGHVRHDAFSLEEGPTHGCTASQPSEDKI